jgi:cation:H+ antiporter
LALATDLPEVVTAVAAAGTGEPGLAVSNLYGTIGANVAILAVADLFVGAGALTYFTPSVRVTVQGLLVALLLALTLVGMIVGEPVSVLGAGLFAAIGAAVYLVFVWALGRFDADRAWRPMDLPDAMHPPRVASGAGRYADTRMRRLVAGFVGVALVTLLASLLLVGSATALAHGTGLGTGFVGSTLLAIATSLPELTTTIAAVRLKAYGMAFGNVFGSNAVAAALVFVVDVVHPGAPVLRDADRGAQLGAVAGIGLTVIYLVGLLTRQRRTVARMGLDSLLVLLAYGATLFGYYALR